ncbi:MAG: CoA transferase [Oscillibacter sp.]|nr:CoA transferase [Oscillibacter sp.]
MYKRPLTGVRVIDLTTAGAGPSCTKLLAEWGADVIWIEPPAGCSARTVHKFDFYSVEKRSLVLNLKQAQGREAAYRLIETADVFVTNYRPQAVKRLGLDYETLREKNPQLIYAALTGYGTVGPQAAEPGYDPSAFWAKGGLLRDIAEPDSLVVPPISIGDVATGQGLAGAVCAALFGRLAGNHSGQYLSVSLLGEAAYLNHDALIENQYGERYPHTRKAPRRALLNTYRCGDGEWLVFIITTNFEKDFVPFMDLLGLGDIAGRYTCVEDTMYEHAPELVAILDQAFLRFRRDDVVEKMRALGIPVSRVQSTADLLSDEQVLANRMIYPMRASDPPAGAAEPYVVIPASPVKFNDLSSGIHDRECRGPKLGEHSVEILRECGYSREEISAMLEGGVTAQTAP